MDEPTNAGATPPGPEGAARARRSIWGNLALAILAVALPLVSYNRDPGPWADNWLVSGDECFHMYQLSRAAELNGRWWKVADDPKLGGVYQSDVAKHPGLYEGVDLMLLSTLTARYFDPKVNFQVMVVAILAINGGIAGWLVKRLTGSTFWAALAIVAITLNFPTAGRLGGHLHLFKHGWVLLAVWCFSRYLQRPGIVRGILLGLSAAWVLQGTFYFGVFLVLGLGSWWLGALIAGRLGREHVPATIAAGLAGALAAGALLFPLWTSTKTYLLSDDFANRPREQTYLFSSLLWQYVVPPTSTHAFEVIKELKAKETGYYGEGWNYPGGMVLLGVAAYLVARLRGVKLGRDPRFLDLAIGLGGLFVVLSLTGGPGHFLHDLIPSIRCYSRAGLMTLALGCVAAPVALHAVTGRMRSNWLRVPILAAIVALTGYEGYVVQARFGRAKSDTPNPSWVAWLKDQPKEVRLAAFSPARSDAWYWLTPLYHRFVHEHTTLNGGEFHLLEADLKLLGAWYNVLNLDSLRFVASLGFNTFAFDPDHLKLNPWVPTVPWLEPICELDGGWKVYRVRPDAPRFPATTVERLVAEHSGARNATPEAVPERAWVTGQFALDRTMVVGRTKGLKAVWLDQEGRRVGEPTRVLNQHVYGPDLPAYTVRTPKEPGTYRLAFFGSSGEELGSRPYRVDPTLKTVRRAFGGALPDVAVNPLTITTVEDQGLPARIELRNDSPYYLQAEGARDNLPRSTQGLPGMSPEAPVSAMLVLRSIRPEGDWPEQAAALLLPHDLPPGGRLTMALPTPWPRGPGKPTQFIVTPHFAQVGQKIVLPVEKADLKIGVAPTQARQVAGQPGETSVR